MARKRPPDQVDRLLDAAEAVFRRAGRRGAQMSAVAGEAGVGLGTVYHYFTGKEALMRWAITRALLPSVRLPTDLPIGPPHIPLEHQIAPLVDLPERFPLLHEPPPMPAPGSDDPRGAFRPVVVELYGALEEGRRVIDLVEAATVDDEHLARIWFGDMVERLVAAWSHYISQVRTLHALEPVESADLAARFVITSCTFFARTRHSARLAGSFPPDEEVRHAIVEMIVDASAASPPPTTRPDRTAAATETSP